MPGHRHQLPEGDRRHRQHDAEGVGETLAQIRAEAQNPRGDVWFGGTGDPHLVAAEEGLSAEYKAAAMSQLQPWAIRQYEAAKGKSIGVYSGAVGFGFNKELLAKKNLAEPKCWADIVKPEYKGEIQVANPNSSGPPMSSSRPWCSSWARIRPSPT